MVKRNVEEDVSVTGLSAALRGVDAQPASAAGKSNAARMTRERREGLDLGRCGWCIEGV
jgi:hypothetical protein